MKIRIVVGVVALMAGVAHGGNLSVGCRFANNTNKQALVFSALERHYVNTNSVTTGEARLCEYLGLMMTNTINALFRDSKRALKEAAAATATEGMSDGSEDNVAQ